MASKSKKSDSKSKREARPAASPSVLARAQAPELPPPPPPKPKRFARPALRALVPSAVNPTGEADPFLAAYKAKWLSRLDFTSDMSLESLLMLSFLVLAHGRESEAERYADHLIKHVDLRRPGVGTRTMATMSATLHLSAWLKAKRGIDVAPFLSRARFLERSLVERNREWLSHEAAQEIADAVERKKLDYLLYPLGGIVRWLNDTGARVKAESLLSLALNAARKMMQS